MTQVVILMKQLLSQSSLLHKPSVVASTLGGGTQTTLSCPAASHDTPEAQPTSFPSNSLEGAALSCSKPSNHCSTKLLFASSPASSVCHFGLRQKNLHRICLWHNAGPHAHVVLQYAACISRLHWVISFTMSCVARRQALTS